MKIISVDIIKMFKKPSKNAEAAVGGVPWHPVCVRSHTDEGITGYGEIGVAYGNAQNAGFGMGIDFSKCIIGMDPMNNEEIWNRLHRLTFWGMGNGGVIMDGISGIDIALWDIKGKALDAPVYQLMGRKTNHKLRAYASQLQFDWGKTIRALVRPEEYAEAARKAMADGFTAVKVGSPSDLTKKDSGWGEQPGRASEKTVKAGGGTGGRHAGDQRQSEDSSCGGRADLHPLGVPAIF